MFLQLLTETVGMELECAGFQFVSVFADVYFCCAFCFLMPRFVPTFYVEATLWFICSRF